MSFNQILIKANEPLLFHTGMRALFPLVADAVSRVLPIASLRWISFGHVEADECGAMNHWLEAVPDAQVAFRGLGCMVSINDLADRSPRPLDDGESIDLGDKQVRYLATPHVPHGWEAGVLFEETTSTLPCGDLFTQTGDGPAICNDSPMEPTIAAEDVFGYSTLTPSTAATVERLAGLAPTTLALMHGPTYTGDGEQWLRDLAAMSRAKRRVACPSDRRRAGTRTVPTPRDVDRGCAWPRLRPCPHGSQRRDRDTRCIADVATFAAGRPHPDPDHQSSDQWSFRDFARTFRYHGCINPGSTGLCRSVRASTGTCTHHPR